MGRISVARSIGLEFESDISALVELMGAEGATINQVVEWTGLSRHHSYRAVTDLCERKVIKVIMRSDRFAQRLVPIWWEEPAQLDLTNKQRSALDYLISHMGSDGKARASFKDIAAKGNLALGGLTVILDALDKKGYIDILERGRGSTKSLFLVHPKGDGARQLSPMSAVAPRVSDAEKRRRREVMKRLMAKPRQAMPYERQYPFSASRKAAPGNDLVQLVNASVPRGLSPDNRADICQEIIVGILCGEIDRDNIEIAVKEKMKSVNSEYQSKYGDLSLDAAMGDSELRLIDTLAEEDSIWNKI